MIINQTKTINNRPQYSKDSSYLLTYVSLASMQFYIFTWSRYDILEKKMNLCGFFLSQIVKLLYSILFYKYNEMVVFTAKEIKYATNKMHLRMK